MKIFLKHLLTKNNLIILVIFFMAFFLRFYNFSNRVTFWTEQARSLVVSANYIHGKLSLLGQEYFRQDSNSHIIYSGALFNYSLIPLLLLSNYDPLKITVYFAFLNLFTGLAVFIVGKRIFNFEVGLISLFLFMFNADMIYHSLFIWNYNYLPLVGVLLLYFTWRHLKFRKTLDMLILGLISGVGISIQFLFIPIAVCVLLINLSKRKHLLINLLLFAIGVSVANIPTILFDLRHQFYEMKTLFQYLIDTLNGKSDAGIAYYYFLPFWPVVIIYVGYIFNRFLGSKHLLSTLILCLYLYINVFSIKVSFYKPLGMPKGINLADVNYAARVIASDATGNFNVAEVLDFDKRAYVLRYYTEFVFNRKPLGDTDYKNVNQLYVLSQKDYNFGSSSVWEIASGGRYKVGLLANIGDDYGIYKLTK